MAVRSARLWHPTYPAASGGGTTLYTCPSGVTALIKDLNFVNSGSSTATIKLCVNSLVASQALFWNLSMAANTHTNQGRFIVLEPGDTIVALLSVANTISCAGYGAELDGVAP